MTVLVHFADVRDVFYTCFEGSYAYSRSKLLQLPAHLSAGTYITEISSTVTLL